MEAVFGRNLDLFKPVKQGLWVRMFEPLPVDGVRGVHGEPDVGTVLPEDEGAVT